jgi:hypothetical protein
LPSGPRLPELGLYIYIWGMQFDLQLLSEPDANGSADVMENRTLAAGSVEEGVRLAKDIVLKTPVPGIFGFRLIRNGLEVCHWFIGQRG